MKKTSKFAALLLAGVCAVSTCFASGVSAAEAENPYASWPEKDITIVYNTKAGSGGDMFLRQIVQALENQDALNGHKIIVENIVDNTGYSAWVKVRDAEKDGYYLGMSSPKLVTANIVNGVELPWDGFTYLAGMGMDNQYLFCRADAPYDTLEELVEYAKENTVNCAVSSPNGQSLAGVLMIEQALDFSFNKITYTSGSDQIVAMLGNFIDVGCIEYGEITSQIEEGQFKLLATMGSERSPFVPDTPTCKECGVDMGIDRVRGIFGPADMDPDLAARIYEVLAKAYDDEELMAYMTNGCIDTVLQTGEEFYDSYAGMAQLFIDNLDLLTAEAAQ